MRFSAPGQMKTQKEALALQLKIDQLREMQADQLKRHKEAEMMREGIPLNRDEEVDRLGIHRRHIYTLPY